MVSNTESSCWIERCYINNHKCLFIPVMERAPEDTAQDTVVTAKFSLSSSLALTVPSIMLHLVTVVRVEMATPLPAQMQKTDDLSFSPMGIKQSQVFCVALHCFIYSPSNYYPYSHGKD